MSAGEVMSVFNAEGVAVHVLAGLVNGVVDDRVRLVPEPAPTGRYRLVADVDPAACDAFGVRLLVEGAARWLQLGYHSWDTSQYLPIETGGTGYALTQLASGGGFLQLGFVRHDRLQHRFTLRESAGQRVLDVEALWDRRRPADGSSPPASEELRVQWGARADDLLRDWAQQVAVGGPRPRRGPPITGWSSWYNLYAAISADTLRAELADLRDTDRREGWGLSVVQIDDGFTPEMGDWLTTKPQFPDGMKPLLNEIRASGYVPGLWIAPFLIGNRSELYATHPDWAVGDRETGRPYVCMRFYGEFRWHKRSEEYYLLDTTHPEAMAYLRRVFRTWRHEWGCGYFKTDFLYHAVEAGPERMIRHRSNLSRAEIIVAACRAIRDEIGPEATWVACGAPFWMLVGLVDAVRIGRDAGVSWPDGMFAALSTRGFANGILWQADPDALLLRERFHALAPEEQQTIATAQAMVGGVTMTSDSVGELSQERRSLFAAALDLTPGTCRYPILGTGDPAFVQWRPDANLLHLVNPTADPLLTRIPLSSLGLSEPPTIRRASLTGADSPLPETVVQQDASIVAELAPRSGVLLRVLRGSGLAQ
ncbi:glycoside hydrolase family 36 protein [Raineyella fluvialis]|uniref:Alpha-galactosidase n=1 Tax=Raineyella fluvialis TaxID=2662261 RepID=A0A5Q2FFJ4_9ACTN|nr:glycoside hydrolase family 36 protein [Raineyella fluvialis]QGF24557.1 hypothetical protein Rai3103_13935 [Raineyella fluvialis]